MEIVTFTGPNGTPFPRDTRLRVVAKPKNELIFEGTVSNAHAEGLDPGKYEFVAVKHDKTTGGYRYQATVLVGCTEASWKRLQHMEPRGRARQTTAGIRWKCPFSACDETFTNKFAALVHEAGHQGTDLLADLREDPVIVPEKRGPGRPPKSV